MTDKTVTTVDGVEYVTIKKSEYQSLLDESRKLTALENAGVDNWEWYGDAMSEFYGEEDEDEEDE